MRAPRRSKVQLLSRACAGAACVWFAAATSVPAIALTPEERATATRAVQRVYHAHQLGDPRPFDEAVPWSATLTQAEDVVAQSWALRRFWGIEVGQALLAREVERIRRGTRDPARLREIDLALGNDSMMFAEVVARPVLVSRLLRYRFNWDRRIHAEPRREADLIARRCREGACPESAPGALRRAIVTSRSADPETFSRWQKRLLRSPRSVGSVQELESGFVITTHLEHSEDHLRLEEYFVPKVLWSSWWSQVLPSLSSNATFEEPPSLEAPGATPEATGCEGDDTWAAGSLEAVTEREGHSLVWTGTRMIVWGGETATGEGSYPLNTGAAFDPALNAWIPISRSGAPSARSGHTAVWTGKEMLIWGGSTDATGARYDPVRDVWSPMAVLGAPEPRTRHVAVWTGSELIVWGGAPGNFDSGGRYDPDRDRWTPLPSVNAPAGRADAAAVWTGSAMIVWGGQSATSDDVMFGDGARYDPRSNAWQAISSAGSPSPRWGHRAVWTGSTMIVWGGANRSDLSTCLNDGRRYDPESDGWSSMSTAGAPTHRAGHSQVWTGFSMLVWGGQTPTGSTVDGAIYVPSTDVWSPMNSTSAPFLPGFHRAVWTGSELIVWGGGDRTIPAVAIGGRYSPAADQWTPVPTTTGGPSGRLLHTAVWTGNQMIVWGGWGGDAIDDYPTGGGRFDPALDSWLPMNAVGAPHGREDHSAVWTGSRMVLWGGKSVSAGGTETTYADGGAYDPLLDVWGVVSTANAPSARRGHTAVWSGSRMVVWGGADPNGTVLGTGGRYDPALNQWQSVSTLNAPVARYRHTSTWTGTQMIVWGGSSSSGGALRSGARYNPVTDTWSATTLTGAPPSRFLHTAVWTGSRLVVWGGYGATFLALRSGGRYDPATDSWSPTSLTGAPTERHLHTAVWTGTEMVIWGGDPIANNLNTELATGGRYDPALDTWKPTSTKNSPQARDMHVALWTGNAMLVWSGEYATLDTGGTYVVGPPDADADGVADACDCAANDASSTAVPTEATALRFASDKIALTWYASTGGSGTAHDVVRGTLATFPVGSGGESCLASGLAEARLDDPATPASGGWWYLVRGRNACGPGTYGAATGGTRVTGVCP